MERREAKRAHTETFLPRVYRAGKGMQGAAHGIRSFLVRFFADFRVRFHRVEMVISLMRFFMTRRCEDMD